MKGFFVSGAMVRLVGIVFLGSMHLLACERTTPVGGHAPLGGEEMRLGTGSHGVQWVSLKENRHEVIDQVFSEILIDPQGRQKTERILLMLSVLDSESTFAWSRLALNQLGFGSATSRFRGVLDITKRLAVERPEHPDRLFLEGYLRWFALRGGLAVGSNSIAEQSRKGLVSMWTKLLELEPGYRGPQGFDAARIRDELSLVNKSSHGAQ